MLHNLRVLAPAIALLLPHAAPRAHMAGAPLRILWVGNSYTYVNDLPKIITQLAESSKVDRRPAAEDTIVAAYRALGNAVHAQLALAGRAWMDVIAQDPAVELYQNDGSHPDPQGSYIAACVFYEVLFDRSPVGLPAIGVTRAQARRAQQAAHKVLALGK